MNIHLMHGLFTNYATRQGALSSSFMLSTFTVSKTLDKNFEHQRALYKASNDMPCALWIVVCRFYNYLLRYAGSLDSFELVHIAAVQTDVSTVAPLEERNIEHARFAWRFWWFCASTRTSREVFRYLFVYTELQPCAKRCFWVDSCLPILKDSLGTVGQQILYLRLAFIFILRHQADSKEIDSVWWQTEETWHLSGQTLDVILLVTSSDLEIGVLS